jgi:hypothetical protein
MMSSDEVVRDNIVPNGMPLDADAMVKASLGTLLGGRSKDSIIDITRI